MNIWEAKVILPDEAILPDSADLPMRQAVRAACQKMTDHEPSDILSGWDGKLTEIERSIIGRPENNSIADARKCVADAFKADPNFRNSYVANVAMLLHDKYGITDYEQRNAADDDIVRLIFESK